MKIILVITDNKGKSLLFVLDNFKALTLTEAISYVKKGKINDVHLVEAKGGVYLRSNPNQTSTDNLDSISISINALTKIPNQEETAIINKYLKTWQISLEKEEEESIYIEGKKKTTEEKAIKHLKKYRAYIFAAAKHFKIDAYLLGAILIDEYARLDLKDKFDWTAMFGEDRSVGVAQVKIETARDLIKKGYYNPKHSIYFAAARIKQLIDSWRKFIDLGANKPKNKAMLASLYSLIYREPHIDPKPNLRGEQIAKEFYKIAKKALKS